MGGDSASLLTLGGRLAGEQLLHWNVVPRDRYACAAGVWTTDEGRSAERDLGGHRCGDHGGGGSQWGEVGIAVDHLVGFVGLAATSTVLARRLMQTTSDATPTVDD